MIRIELQGEDIASLAKRLHDASLAMGYVPGQGTVVETAPAPAPAPAPAKDPEPQAEAEAAAPAPKKTKKPRKKKTPTVDACVEAMKNFVMGHPTNEKPNVPSDAAKAEAREILDLFDAKMTQDVAEENRQELLDTIAARYDAAQKAKGDAEGSKEPEAPALF